MIKIALFILFFIITSNSSQANNHCSSLAGRLVSVQGQVTVNNQTVETNSEICSGNLIATGMNSRAAIYIHDQNTILRLNQNTQYTIGEDENNNPVIEILEGIIHIFSRVPRSLRVKTPYVNATIEGTEFVINVGNNQSDVIVLEGQVRVSNTFGEVVLNSGEAASTDPNQAPVRREIIKPLN